MADNGPNCSLVVVDGRTWAFQDGQPLVFGRAVRPGGVEIGLDAEDAGISRQAGRLRIVDDSRVVLENRSERRALLVEYPQIVRWQRVEPRGHLVLAGEALVLVRGRRYTHGLRIVPGERHRPPVDPLTVEPGVPTIDDDGFNNDEDRRALIALASGYLRRWPRHDETPLKYEEAASLAGHEPISMRRRIDRLRVRLRSHELYFEGDQALRELIEWAIDHRVIGVGDLAELAGSAGRPA
jgi:hypothetical protein